NAAVKNNLGDVQNLLGGENGLSKQLGAVTDAFNKSGGLISAAQDGATKSAADLKKQFDATSERIEAKMANYRAQFTALDSLVAQMNSTSTYLTQQLSMLGNMNEK
ncbi:MAG TPA: flagellar filament capping protein FliD, partial [Eoetvoesiella sp.]